MQIENHRLKRKVAFFTLGCKLNYTETSALVRQFQERGYEKVDIHDKADIYVINTCTVTHIADKKSRQVIRRITRNSPKALVIVVGCYSQLSPEKLAKIEGVDLVLGNNEKFEIFAYIDLLKADRNTIIHACDIHADDTFNISYSVEDRTRSFLKIQDGCDYYCTYCTVPYARGRSRNLPIKEAIDTANYIAEKGIKEIVLTGVNIGDYGKSTGESFYELIQELERSTDIDRYRISSIEPNLLTNEIIEFVSVSDTFMPHFHLPLQSGCDDILQRMKRRYDTKLFCDRVAYIKSIIPYAGIGVDVIVGFPGESDKQFMHTYSLLNGLDISYLHVFTYSDRKKTMACSFNDKVEHKIKAERSKKLQILTDKKRTEFYNRNLGKAYEVLFEAHVRDGMINGFTENYIKTEYMFRPEFVGKIKNVSLDHISQKGNVVVRM